MKRYVRSSDEIVRYDIGAMDWFKAVKILESNPSYNKYIRKDSNYVDNYDHWKLVGPAAELQPILKLLRSNGVTPRKHKITDRDIKFLNN